MKTIWVALSAFLLLVPPADAQETVPSSQVQIDLTFAPLVKSAAPAVVNIYTRTVIKQRATSPFFDDPFFRQFFGIPDVPRERIQQSLGSGVVVDAAKGYVLTNNHVIAGQIGPVSV